MLIYISNDVFREEVLNAIQSSGYELNSYLLTINTPVYFIVSDAVIFDELKKK